MRLVGAVLSMSIRDRSSIERRLPWLELPAYLWSGRRHRALHLHLHLRLYGAFRQQFTWRMLGSN